ANYCTVQVVRFGKEPARHYGARCDKFERNSSSDTSWEDLAAFRRSLFFGPWEREALPSAGPVVGIPRNLFTYEMFPLFWKIFSSLGIRVLLSEPSNGEIVKNTYDTCRTTPCMPYKLISGTWMLFSFPLCLQEITLIILQIQEDSGTATIWAPPELP
ncbi:MAG: hypothetical protein HYU64_02150, partial [Armatimonadetes bacterium]|nr:hypothetical protein [Armatimonadota bacterium]